MEKLSQKPKSIDDVIGCKKQIEYLQNWLETLDPPYVMLYGPSGCGKSLVSELLLKDYDVLNVNTNNNVPKTVIIDQIKQCNQLRGFSKKGRAVIIESFDKIFGDKHYKQFKSICKNIPIICILNKYNKSYTNLVKFTKPSYSDLFNYLYTITTDMKYIDKIIKSCNYDIRKCINTILLGQNISTTIFENNQNDLFIKSYEYAEKLLGDEFHSTPFRILSDICYNDYQNIASTIYENIPYIDDDIESISKSYELFSISDNFTKLINTKRMWEYTDYVIYLSCVKGTQKRTGRKIKKGKISNFIITNTIISKIHKELVYNKKDINIIDLLYMIEFIPPERYEELGINKSNIKKIKNKLKIK